MRSLARWGALSLVATPLTAWPLGLGEIELHSALNQPFDAEIVISATPEELAGLRVNLAPITTFQRAGVDRPSFLSSLNFRVARNERGQNVIRISSTQSITEPFVTMLVEAAAAGGLWVREYTVLLDPPVLLPVPAAPAPVTPAQNRPQSNTSGPIPRAETSPAPTPPAERPPLQASSPPAQRPVAPPPQAGGGTYGPVQNAETLWGIATQYRPGNVTMNQMLVALYEANPQAFNGNMNELRRGAILRIPELSELQSRAPGVATAEVQRQTDTWRGGQPQQQARLRLVAPSDEAPAGVGAGAAADGADTAQTAALENRVSELEAELAERERLLEVQSQELADLQRQLSASDDVAEPETLPAEDVGALEPEPAELESEALFVDEEASEGLGAEEPEAVEAEPVAAAASTVTQTQAQPAPEGPSLVSEIIGYLRSPVVLIGAGAGVVLLAALLFLRRRRGDIEDVTGQWEALEAETDDGIDNEATTRMRRKTEPDDLLVVEQARDAQLDDEEDDPLGEYPTGTFAQPDMDDVGAQTMSSQTVINLDQADPIAEADFHMAYGLYDQAADLVSKALEAAPGNRELQLKLLEVYFVWGNKEAFLQTAKSLRAEMGASPDADWDKVIIMGKQICPDEILFAEATAAAGDLDLDLEAGSEPALDLSFGADDTDDDPLASTDVGDVDLDLSSLAGDDDLDFELETSRSKARETLDDDDDRDVLDIGAQTSAGLAAALFDTEDAAGAETSPNVDLDALDSLAVTQESPTIETPAGDFGDDDDWSAITMESPTIEAAGAEAPTVESAMLDGDSEDLDTIETANAGDDYGYGGGSSAEYTAEIDLDDLGLNVEDVEGLPDGLGELPSADDDEDGAGEEFVLGSDDDDDLLSATGVTQVLQGDDEDDEDFEHVSTAVIGDQEDTMATSTDSASTTRTEVLEQPDLEETGQNEALDLDLDDFSSALQGGDTIEQPRGSLDVFGESGDVSVDLDIGADFGDDDDPTGTEEVGPLDPQTMTEVGTKLDLARAYIDMGDPDGARSILQEVLDEGDSGQRREAQSLIDALPV